MVTHSHKAGWRLREDVVSSVLLKHAVFWEVCASPSQEHLQLCAALAARYGVQLMAVRLPKIEVGLTLRWKKGQRQSPLE